MLLISDFYEVPVNKIYIILNGTNIRLFRDFLNWPFLGLELTLLSEQPPMYQPAFSSTAACDWNAILRLFGPQVKNVIIQYKAIIVRFVSSAIIYPA